MRTMWPAVGTVVLGLTALSACGSSDADTDADGDAASTVEIGVVTSLSGDFGAYGPPFRDGAAYAVEEINKDGFTVAGEKYRLKLIVSDDRSDQSAAVQAATGQIRDDGVIAILGPIGPLGPAVTQVASAAGVINFSSSSSVAGIAGPPDNPLTFTTVPSEDVKVTALLKSIQDYLPDAEKMAVLAPDDATAATTGKAIKEQFESAGIAVENFLYPTDTADLSTVVTRLAASKPDVVFSGWANAEHLAHASQLRSQLPDVPVVLNADTISTCKKEYGGRECIANPLAGADLSSTSLSPTAREFKSGFLGFTDEDELPAQTAAVLWTYDFPGLLVQAMEKAGTVTDTGKIAEALHEVQRDGLLGSITFDDENNAVFGLDISMVNADGSVDTQHFG